MILALDIGGRRTGAALADTASGFVVALDTIKHTSTKELVAGVASIVQSKKISTLAVGLPILLGGEEGEQANHTKTVAEEIRKAVNLPLIFVDERYTTQSPKNVDPDAKAACHIAEIALSRAKKQ